VGALSRLQRLRCLVLPLLALHGEARGALEGLEAALPNCVIQNISSSFGSHAGAQWFGHFDARARDWWARPAAPWAWHPTLHLSC
jgi:hypothetical protein